MLKVKLNINEEELQRPEFIRINEIQFNYKHIVFPFYDNDTVQFVKLEKIGDFYELSYLEGFNEDEVIVKVEDLDEKYHGEAIEKFLEFNNEIITEYEESSLKETIIHLLNNENYYISAELEDNNVILRVETNSVLGLIYNVDVNSYGVISAQGNIVDRELDKIIYPNIEFTLDKGFGEEVSNEELLSLFDSIDEDYLKENILNSLK